jgi:BirA family transcriptional regulator, biotin operon repressor / biotin---[acetyl-CoA-carboxylase] ligase
VIRDELTEDAILPLVRQLRIPWRVHAYGSVISTNDTAKRLADGGGPEGTLVVAETQTGGHGRRGNVWESPAGGLWFSFLVRPHLPPERASGLSVVTAVAVARAVNEVAGLRARIKWPNDVFIGRKKLAGAMIVSAGDGRLVVGVGVNVNVPEASMPSPRWYEATSLMRETGEECQRPPLLARILAEFESRYFAYRGPDHARFLQEWRELSLVVGEWVTAGLDGETVQGTVFDMEEDCGLVLRLANGAHRKLLPTGDVTLSVGTRGDSA